MNRYAFSLVFALVGGQFTRTVGVKNRDIHGNHAAFEQCLKYALTNNIDKFIFGGDYLGEFPYPQKTMEMQESGLEKAAPYWTQITKHLMLTGEVSHGTVLAKAMKLCEEAIGKCSWYNISPKYWKKAIAELLT